MTQNTDIASNAPNMNDSAELLTSSLTDELTTQSHYGRIACFGILALLSVLTCSFYISFAAGHGVAGVPMAFLKIWQITCSVATIFSVVAVPLSALLFPPKVATVLFAIYSGMVLSELLIFSVIR